VSNEENPFGQAAPAATTGDPFGGVDPFTSASATFPAILDLEDCLILLWPTKHLTGLVSKMGDNKEYEAMECRIVVLDGTPINNLAGQPLPQEIQNLRVIGSAIVPQLVGQRLVLGRVESFQSDRFKKGSKGAKLAPPTDDDKVKARVYLAHHAPVAASAA
jgi:hypothetical protein